LTEERLTNLSYLKLLISIDGLGPVKIISLYNHFKNFENIFSSSIFELCKIDGINKNLSRKIISEKPFLLKTKDSLELELERLESESASILTIWDRDYPELLRNIYYPPLLLYMIGHFSYMDKNSIAIVGTRQPTTYGKQQAEKFAMELSRKNITVVSGLARGIDSIAHQSALNAGGRTIAVIGSGLDVIYPPENKKLFYEIKESGIIISEYELGTKPDAQNFPRRNRIISGLSLGSLIIETKLNGGALQTAAYAIDQNREVFAVPGNVNIKQSEGPNSLIQKGEAKLVMSVDDILSELKIKPIVGKNIPKPSVGLTLFEEKLMQVLGYEPKHIDEIASLSSMLISDCLVNLLTLEFKGMVKQLPGKMFVLLN